MPFPQGGDFVRDVSNDFTVVKADRRICRHDNGTTVCDRGHKLKYPGTCFSQPIGTYNSTDVSFQPTFPICTSDYVSEGFNDGVLYARVSPEKDHFVALGDSQVERDHPLYQMSNELERVHDIFKMAITKEGDTFFAKVASQVVSAYFFEAVPSTVSTFWRMAQFQPGVLPHLPGVFSDLFAYDVFTSFTVVNRLVMFMIDTLAARIKVEGKRVGTKNLVQTEYYTTISGSDDMCVGDSVPPYITLYQPTASGIQVRPRDQIVDFSLTDVVGGVDLSSVYVSVTSTTSGTFSLLAAGVDQTGGDVSVVGDASSYRFTYTPSFLWEYNDLVTVNISGSDLAPMVDGNPFFCGAAQVNTFIGDVLFQVLNQDDFGASLTVIGDVDSPYIASPVPASGTTGNSVFTPVTVRIADDLTGVDLSELFVYVDGVAVVENGVPSTGETTVGGVPSRYEVVHTPTTAFAYDSTVEVTVIAQDRVEVAPPNVLSATYDFSFIEDSTLIIENFVPGVGTSKELDSLDIEVDIRDDTYGVDTSQCFFVINGVIVSGTQTPLVSGTHLLYHPPNDFAFEESIRVTVHGTNNNVVAPVVKEAFYTLYYGRRIVLFNQELYEHGESVDVFVHARNLELLYKDLSTGYFFTSYTQPQKDLGASIYAINPIADLPASLTVLAPEHRYGQTVTVEFSVEDFDGYLLGPYTFVYTIENRSG